MSFRNKRAGRALLPFGLDYNDLKQGGEGEQSPRYVLPVNGDLGDLELAVATQTIGFTNLMNNGPFHTGSLRSGFDKKEGTTAPDGIERHSDKYKHTKEIGRNIDEHPYILEFFPDELHSVMGISNKQKKLLASTSTATESRFQKYSGNEPDPNRAEHMLEKLKDMAEGLDDSAGQKPAKDEENEDEDEDVDDEFEEEEDDDYNAEKYFDDGDDDIDGDEDDEVAF